MMVIMLLGMLDTIVLIQDIFKGPVSNDRSKGPRQTALFVRVNIGTRVLRYSHSYLGVYVV